MICWHRLQLKSFIQNITPVTNKIIEDKFSHIMKRVKKASLNSVSTKLSLDDEF